MMSCTETQCGFLGILAQSAEFKCNHENIRQNYWEKLCYITDQQRSKCQIVKDNEWNRLREAVTTLWGSG
jgi:hypothetical protein